MASLCLEQDYWSRLSTIQEGDGHSSREGSAISRNSSISEVSCFKSRNQSRSCSRSQSKDKYECIHQGKTQPRFIVDNLSQVSTSFASDTSPTCTEPFGEHTGGTALLLCWDDTLFPTTWLLQDVGIESDQPIRRQIPRGHRRDHIEGLMDNFASRIAQFLREASTTTAVFIVTLSKKGWVESTIKNFMPELAKVFEECDIMVICEQDDGTQDEFTPSSHNLDVWSTVKAEAVVDLLSDEGIWENIISIGDFDVQSLGTVEAARRFLQDTANECSSRIPWIKTLKMLDDPTAEELIAQLTLIRRWLPHLILRKESLNLHIDNSEEDEVLTEIHKVITGEDESFSWAALAGMDTAQISYL